MQFHPLLNHGVGEALSMNQGKKISSCKSVLNSNHFNNAKQFMNILYLLYYIIRWFDVFGVFLPPKKTSIPSHPPVVPPLPGRRWCPDGGDGGVAWDERGATSNGALANRYEGFLSHRGTPSHHPFLIGIFHEINHPAIKGYHQFVKHPYCFFFYE